MNTRMSKFYAKAAGVAAVLTLGLGACVTTPEVTHHWVSQSEVTGAEYRRDMVACGSVEEVTADSAAFKAYEQCMNQRGYQLASVTDVEAARERR
ncbi:MAG: hypothetical protein AAF515_01970 [Pseudomonadota bacterium]